MCAIEGEQRQQYRRECQHPALGSPHARRIEAPHYHALLDASRHRSDRDVAKQKKPQRADALADGDAAPDRDRLPVDDRRILDVEKLEIPPASQRIANRNPTIDEPRSYVALRSGLVQVIEPTVDARDDGAEALLQALDGEKRLTARGERLLFVAHHGGRETGSCEARFDFREPRGCLPREAVDVGPVTLPALRGLAHLQHCQASRLGIGAYQCRCSVHSRA